MSFLSLNVMRLAINGEETRIRNEEESLREVICYIIFDNFDHYVLLTLINVISCRIFSIIAKCFVK